MKSNIVVNKKTGEKVTAIYAPTKSGNLRYHIDGKPLTDKKFDSLYSIVDGNEENIFNTLVGKKVLFIENDNALENGLDEFENILKKIGVKYTVLFTASEQPFDKILSAINTHDCIVFQTQWVYDISKKIKEYMLSLLQKKIVIECYISEPSFYYKPDTIHDVYIYSCQSYWGEADKETETFYKLSDKAYWDYKNGFDS